VAEKIAPQGRITIENSDDLRKELLRALRAKPENLSVDLSGVSYIDTSGLATLVEASRVAHKQGTKLILTGVHDQPQYLLQISHFDKILDIEGQKASV
jgi:anti-sigma B factor antagonist